MELDRKVEVFVGKKPCRVEGELSERDVLRLRVSKVVDGVPHLAIRDIVEADREDVELRAQILKLEKEHKL